MNCKPGDLAIVIRAKHSENVGKIVRVIEPHDHLTHDVILLKGTELAWLCETTGGDLVYESALACKFIHRRQGPIPDMCLRPLVPIQIEDYKEACVVVTQHSEHFVAA
jgi:hypothetical protein